MSPRDGTGLVKHHRVNIRQRFNEISPLYQDPDLGSPADGGGKSRGCRQFQSAGKIDKEHIQNTLDIPGCSIDCSGRQEFYYSKSGRSEACSAIGTDAVKLTDEALARIESLTGISVSDEDNKSTFGGN